MPEPVGSEALAEGLMLVRASTLKVIRLQLAMERHDRRGALEAVDDLVALDRKLQDYLGDSPAMFGQERLRDELEREQASLHREKLALAAGVIRRPEPAIIDFPASEPAGGDILPDEPFPTIAYEDEQPGGRRFWSWAAALLVLAGGAVTGMAFVPGLPEHVAASAQAAMDWIR